MWDIEEQEDRPRNLTEWEEKVIRACHHEHGGMTQAAAACKLGITESMVSRTLKSIEKKAETCSPIRCMLPILTKRQFAVYRCIAKNGMSLEATAFALSTSVGSVRNALFKMRRKGQHVPAPVRHEAYTESMDNIIKEKF